MKINFKAVLALILFLGGFIVLCTLGFWQLQRLEWKRGIISKLDQAYSTTESAPLPLALEDGSDLNDVYRYGRVDGIFLARKALLLGPRTQNGQIGNDLIVPVRIADGRTVFVNMGWTPYVLQEQPIYHLDGQHVWFTGLARRARWNSYTPENKPDQDIWYRPDLEEMAASRGLDDIYPLMLYAERASHKFDAAFPHNERWYPRNQHLQYAWFWFAMATAWAGVFILRFLAIKKGSSTDPAPL